MDDISKFTVKELLFHDQYLIPIYQRNYAWSVQEMEQLLHDVADYTPKDGNSKDIHYYIGNLIVYPKRDKNNPDKIIYETIDGQQRLTTLNIILCALKNSLNEVDFNWFEHENISFDNRESSNMTLRAIYKDEIHKGYFHTSYNTAICEVYDHVLPSLEKVCEERKLKKEQFLEFFLNNVIILRVPVPKDTNLNHYFEIMNSRGEQLEQYEVLKARLMSFLPDDPNKHLTFDRVWEACSEMERYVQMNFNQDERKVLFGETWEDIPDIDNFEKLTTSIISCHKTSGTDSELKSIETLFADADNNVKFTDPDNESEDESPDRFHSLINFSNFLLHALKIIYKGDVEIPLDDKRLTATFDEVLKSEKDQESFVGQFICELVKLRFLFDKFIIKSRQEQGAEKWSLRRLNSRKNGNTRSPYYVSTFSSANSDDDTDNNQIIMLLSMFHISSPTLIYKYWMNAALHFVYEKSEMTVQTYKSYLEQLAKTYMLDRYLISNNEAKIEFYDIIYKNNAKPVHTTEDAEWNLLNNGVKVENFVFNFYDYILWSSGNYKDFSFTYRNSVEHFYPQYPVGHPVMDKKYLDNFGNLCLISRGMNSKFSNNMPGAKVDNFGTLEELKTLSLKLQVMMEKVRDKRDWTEDDIEKYFEVSKKEMISFLSI